MGTTALHWSYDAIWTNQTLTKHLKRFCSFTQSESSYFVFVPLCDYPKHRQQPPEMAGIVPFFAGCSRFFSLYLSLSFSLSPSASSAAEANSHKKEITAKSPTQRRRRLLLHAPGGGRSEAVSAAAAGAK
jgi:hypothetical protein